MFDKLEINDVMSERNTAAIIIFLYMFGPQRRTEIYKAISTNPRMPKKLEILKEHGIIKATDGRWDAHGPIELSDAGTTMAKMLCQMERLVGGNLAKYKWDYINRTLDEFTLKNERDKEWHENFFHAKFDTSPKERKPTESAADNP
jgi:hypothetical protein